MNEIPLRVAAKGVIVHDGKVLIVREASTYEEGTNHGRYHLPGGRIEAGEAFLNGLKREIDEEVGLTVKPIRPLYVGEWRPVIKGQPTQIVAIFMLCEAETTEVRLSHEHDDYQWIDPTNPDNLDLMDPEPQVLQAYIDSK